MPAVAVATNKGQPLSLSHALWLTYAPNTPLTSRLPKGKSIGQLYHTYKVKKKRTVVSSGASDGEPVSVSSGKNEQVEIIARVGVFKTSPRVGDLAKHNITVGQTTAQTPGKNAETGASHMAEAVADHLQAMKYGEEVEVCSDQESRADLGPGFGPKFRGVGKWLQVAAQTDQPIDSAVRTPTGQIFTGAIATLTEEALDLLMESRFTANGATSELFGVMSPAIKRTMNLFTRRTPTVASFDSIIRYDYGMEDKTVCRGVDFFETDWGTAEFHPSILMPTDQRAYLLDLEHCEMMPYGPGVEEEDLAKDGGGDAKVLRAMFAFHMGDPRAHIAIKCSGETANTF